MKFAIFPGRKARAGLLLSGMLILGMEGARAVQPFVNLQPSLAVTFTVVNSGPFLNTGSLVMYAGDTSKLGSNPSLANGATLSIGSNTALFTQYGTNFGGNGSTNFKVPNLADTTPIGAGMGAGLTTRYLGGNYGAANVTLGTANLPVSQGGTAQPFTNVQPGLGLYYDIATTGVYPDRGDGSAVTLSNTSGSLNSPFLGQIILTGGSQAGSQYVPANGTNMTISGNTTLFSLLLTNFGGNGTTNFDLPNLQGRTAMGAGGTSTLGEAQGTETNTLTLANLPSPRGSNQPFNNLQPSLTLDYLICAGGTYPGSADGTAGAMGATSVYTGQIITVAFDYAPSGWLQCDGQILSVADYETLFAVIGNTYGGNGTTTFQLPDFRDRVVVGSSATEPVGTISQGTSTVTLLSNQAPASVPEPGVTVLVGLGFLVWIGARKRGARRAL